MAEVKNIGAVKEKWARVTPQRTEDYKIGITNPRRDWATSAAAAKETYKAGVTEAAAKGMYEKGIAAAGSGKWKEKALSKGPGRFAEGVMVAAPDYAKGMEPVLNTIQATQLPPKFAKGDPRNIQRVSVIATALRKLKTG
jgi:hypothetical protein